MVHLYFLVIKLTLVRKSVLNARISVLKSEKKLLTGAFHMHYHIA
jgi:hypothetical protein